jgi:hypothetical protein
MTLAIVFVCSPTIGSYVNAVTHLSSSLSITRFRVSLLSDDHLSAPGPMYREDIATYLDSLANGEYKGVTMTARQAEHYRTAAAILRSDMTTVDTVVMRELPEYLDRACRGLRPGEVTLDVTGLPKLLAVQVTTVALFRKVPVYALELAAPPDPGEPQKALYHAISPGGFRYPCLTSSTVIADSLARLTSKARVAIATLAVCFISVGCFALLLLFKPGDVFVSQLTSWIGLVASVVGIAAAFVQMADTWHTS